MTQQQLALYIGVTKSVISFYELRERAPSPEVLVKCAGLFHVSTDYLLGLEAAETVDISGLAAEDVTLIRAMADRLRQKK